MITLAPSRETGLEKQYQPQEEQKSMPIWKSLDQN